MAFRCRLGLMIAVALLGVYSCGAAGIRTLTVAEAESLARAALPAETKRLPGLSLQADKAARCVTFDVLWANRGEGSVHSQFVTVDLNTGEVWSPMVCKRITTPALLALQRQIRKRLKISSEEARRSVTDYACCALE